MFWNKKDKLEVFRGMLYGHIIAEDSKGQVRLASIEEVREVDAKINLILEHLKLKYVPEKEKKEPAKLVENKHFLVLPPDCHKLIAEMSAYNYGTDDSNGVLVKPKRKYTKKKKSKK